MPEGLIEVVCPKASSTRTGDDGGDGESAAVVLRESGSSMSQGLIAVVCLKAS
jgi:hypothetical protein